MPYGAHIPTSTLNQNLFPCSYTPGLGGLKRAANIGCKPPREGEKGRLCCAVDVHGQDPDGPWKTNAQGGATCYEGYGNRPGTDLLFNKGY